MIIDFNRYNGGGSGSGMTPQEVQQQIDSALTPYWESGETKEYVDEAISGVSVDLSDYYTSAQTQDAISSALEDYYTSAQTEEAISNKGYVTSADVESQIVNKNYITSAYTGFTPVADFNDLSGIVQEQQIVFSSGYNELHTQVMELSGRTTDLSDYYTIDEVNSAITTAFNSATTHIEDVEEVMSTALNAFQDEIDSLSGGGANTILKGVGDVPNPEQPQLNELGDLISLHTLFESEWNTSDETTGKLHIELDGLDKNEVYTIAEFNTDLGQGMAEVKLEYAYDWYLKIYVDNVEYQSGILSEYTSFYYNIPVTTDLEVEDSTYAQVLWLPDDFSGLGGWMIQIGLTDGERGNWIDSYEYIPDLVLTDVEGREYAQGPYYWDGENWKKANEVTLDKVSGMIGGEMDIVWDEFQAVWDEFEAYTPTQDFATINGSAITEGGDLVIEVPSIDLTDYYTSAQTEQAITSKNYVTSAQVETQIVAKNYVTSGNIKDIIDDTPIKRITPEINGYTPVHAYEIQSYNIHSKLIPYLPDIYFATGQTQTPVTEDDSYVNGPLSLVIENYATRSFYYKGTQIRATEDFSYMPGGFEIDGVGIYGDFQFYDSQNGYQKYFVITVYTDNDEEERLEYDLRSAGLSINDTLEFEVEGETYELSFVGTASNGTLVVELNVTNTTQQTTPDLIVWAGYIYAKEYNGAYITDEDFNDVRLVTSTSGLKDIWSGSQEEYDELTNSGSTADPNTFYIITQ